MSLSVNLPGFDYVFRLETWQLESEGHDTPRNSLQEVVFPIGLELQ